MTDEDRARAIAAHIAGRLERPDLAPAIMAALLELAAVDKAAAAQADAETLEIYLVPALRPSGDLKG